MSIDDGYLRFEKPIEHRVSIGFFSANMETWGLFPALKKSQKYRSRPHPALAEEVPVPVIPRIFRCGSNEGDLETQNLPVLPVRSRLSSKASRFTKRVFDVVGALFLLIGLSPLFAVLSMLILMTGRPVFFGHQRIGRNGRPFRCFKFRSMVPNVAEILQELLDNDPKARAEWDRDFKLKGDPRVTMIGKLLRRSSLDELPQLWNVLRGDMSLVGPRPIVETELKYYEPVTDYYFMARPGMTGVWQVSGRNDVGYSQRVYLDCWYVRNWCLWLDIWILLQTVGVVFGRGGAY